MTPQPPAPAVPGWEILGFLGAGGMGDVWKARRADGTVAAIKVARTARGLTPGEAGSLFRREALACLEIDHPHLVRGLDAGTTADGRAFLALEFVEGTTLDALLSNGGALPETRVVELGIALARALGHAHRLGLLHRDVKPKNVILGPGGTVKLLDLGLAELTEDAGAHRLGSRGYAAPEVLARETPGARADLYSLGATLAAAATGELAGRERSFTDRTLPETAGRFTLSPGLRRVVERLLRADPAARYGSAAQVVLDLEALAAGERPLGAILGESGARVARRWPWIAAGVGVAALGVAWIVAPPRETPPIAPDTGAAPAASPSAEPDAKLAAARVYLGRYPDDFVRGREMLAAAGTEALSDAERRELAALRASLEERRTRRVDEAFATRKARAQESLDAGDVTAAVAVLTQWPEEFRDEPKAKEAVALGASWMDRARADAAALAAEIERAAKDAGGAAPDAALLRASVALARPPFEGDQRDRIERARAAILKAAEEQGLRDAGALMQRTAELAWTKALDEHFADPSPARFRRALEFAADEHAPADLRKAAKEVVAARDRADVALADTLAKLKGKPWCGPRGDAMFAGTVGEPPTAEDVFLSKHWAATRGRLHAVAAAARGREEADAWLFARGRWTELAPDKESALARILSGTDGIPREQVWKFDGEEISARVDLTLRDPTSSPAPGQSGNPATAAWFQALTGRREPPTATETSAAAAAKSKGRDAFLADDLATAWTSLTEAESLSPRDAEIAALRGRVLLTGARTFPTEPALFLAFSEGRRAWDLDPKMPAGPVLAAEAGIELLAVANTWLAKEARRAVAAACEAADAMGREDARMLTCAGEWNLDIGRAPRALSLLRRAVAKAPRASATLIALARAEHASGNDDKARAALATATEVLGGSLPQQAAELAKLLEKR
jgi:hypothetical protein